jgi:hypothetical protein
MTRKIVIESKDGDDDEVIFSQKAVCDTCELCYEKRDWMHRMYCIM